MPHSINRDNGAGAGRAAHFKLLWRTAFLYPTKEAGWKRKLFLGGLWIALFAPLGWLMALGYRKEVAFRIIANRQPLLPDWSGWRSFLLDGVKAAGVILVYFAPFLCSFWGLALDQPALAWQHLPEIAAFMAVVALFLPVGLPLLPPLYAHLFPWMHLSGPAQIGLGLLFLLTTFILPSAFMQVSAFGTFRAALKLKNVVLLIVGNLPLYVEAWILSLVATALALTSAVFAPWGIFWSYLVIGAAFNNVLALSDMQPHRSRLSGAKLFHEPLP